MKHDTLTLYFYSSPLGLDWSSPRAMTISTLMNAASRKGRDIGHATIEVCQYEGSETPTRRIHTGMTQLHKKEHLPLILKSGIGLGMLFYDLKGTLEEAPALDEEIDRRSRKGVLSFLKFTISREASNRLFKFAEEYRERGCQVHYGLFNRPLYGEGGGCSAFAASFLEVAGLMNSEYRASWTRLIRVQSRLIGRPIENKYVSFLKLILGRGTGHWADLDEPHREIFFWDPDLMFRWVHKTWGHDAAGYESIRLQNAKGLLRQAHEQPTPTGPIFLKPNS